MIEKFQRKVEELKLELSEEQQSLLHIKSLENFLFHFYNINNVEARNSIRTLLEEYFQRLEEVGYMIELRYSRMLGETYILRIAHFYRAYLGFKVRMSITFVFFVGMHLDLFLLIIGGLKTVYYLPVFTLLLFGYWVYSKVYYEKKRKVYDIGY